MMAIMGVSCTEKASESTAADPAPIGKPQITIEGGRLTPEGLWAMGRIGSVKSDIETGILAYTVSYYSVAENRSTTWIRICDPFEKPTPDNVLRTATGSPIGQSPSPVKGGEEMENGKWEMENGAVYGVKCK